MTKPKKVIPNSVKTLIFFIHRQDVMCGYVYFYPHFYKLINMTNWREVIIPTVSVLDNDRVRIVLEAYNQEIGVLYFERAKRGWNKKPLTHGWTCVDAKVEGLYIYGGDSITPKEIVSWCQELIQESSHDNV